jgi:hypothetical protein
MPEPKRLLKVFLCHAHADRDAVRGLYARLTQDGGIERYNTPHSSGAKPCLLIFPTTPKF